MRIDPNSHTNKVEIDGKVDGCFFFLHSNTCTREKKLNHIYSSMRSMIFLILADILFIDPGQLAMDARVHQKYYYVRASTCCKAIRKSTILLVMVA